MPDSWDFSQPRQRQSTVLANTPVVTYLLIGLSVALTLVSWTHPELGSTAGNLLLATQVPEWNIWSGHVGGLFTAFFVYVDPMHLIFNMYWLYRLGSVVELSMGPLGYMAFMIFATALGSGAELAVDGTTGTGASGAVYGIAGLLWAGRAYSEDWRRVMTRQTLNLFVGWGLFCVVATWLHVMMIANAAHAAGFLFGLSIGWLFFSPRRRWVWIAPLVGLVLVTVVSVTWMPWSGDWLAWRGYHQFLAGRYRAAIASFERSIERGENSAYALDNIERAWTNVAYRAMQRHDSAGMLQAQGEALAAAERLRAAGGKPFDSSNEDSDSGAQPAPPNSPKASRPQALSRRRQAPPQSNRTPLPSLPPPDRDPDKRQTRRRL